jgi:hypothetical protein
MIEIVYFNWNGTKEKMKKEKEIVKNILSKYDGIEMIGVFVPSSEWKHAVIYKSKDFGTFLKAQKEIRRKLHKPEHKEGPRKLEILSDIDSIY